MPPLCRETQSLGQQMLKEPLCINGLKKTFKEEKKVPLKCILSASYNSDMDVSDHSTEFRIYSDARNMVSLLGEFWTRLDKSNAVSYNILVVYIAWDMSKGSMFLYVNIFI